MERFFNGSRLVSLACILLVALASTGFARDYIIYSIYQPIPMGEPNEPRTKNYYVNMGRDQGLKKGTQLNVYRNVSRLDPYNSNKRYNYKIKVGELNVIHSEEDGAIANISKITNDEGEPLLDIDHFMIGDLVDVHVD